MGRASSCLRECPTAEALVTREGGYVMEHMTVRELTAAELNEVSGGVSVNFEAVFGNLNAGIGQLNQQSTAIANTNIGVGQVNISEDEDV